MGTGTIGMMVIMGYLLWMGRMGGGPALTFPWRWKNFKRFSLNWRFVREDWITISLLVVAYPIASAGSLIVGGLFVLTALVAHILIHLRRIAELVPAQNIQDVDVKSDMRSIYLSIIKRWHPDHATDGEDFFRRNHITALANAAFENGDTARLQALNNLIKG